MVDGVEVSVSEVHGGVPSIWDIPATTQLERLSDRNATLPGFDTSKEAWDNPCWIGVLWDAQTSPVSLTCAPS